MFCPECGVEYRPGFAQCSDCMVALVPEKPRRRRFVAGAETELETILLTSDRSMLDSATELLRGAEIPFEIWEAESSWQVLVPGDCEDEARALLPQPAAQLRNDEPLEPDPDLELVTILEGNDPLRIASARSVLEQAGIPFYVAGEELGVRYQPTSGAVHPWCRVQVGADREAAARELVEEFR